MGYRIIRQKLVNNKGGYYLFSNSDTTKFLKKLLEDSYTITFAFFAMYFLCVLCGFGLLFYRKGRKVMRKVSKAKVIQFFQK